MSIVERTKHEGVYKRHARGCGGGDACRCRATYQAKVTLPGGRQRSKTFMNQAQARSWRGTAGDSIRDGTLVVRSAERVGDAWDKTLAQIRRGEVRTRSREPYAPLTIRRYHQAMKLHVIPVLGPLHLSDVQRSDIEALVRRLEAGDAAGSSIRNALVPLQVLYRQGWVQEATGGRNPMLGIETPLRARREGTVVTPDAARRLLAKLTKNPPLQAFWALCFFAGLRRSEALNLAWADIDLDGSPPGLVVRKSKTRAGERWVPILPEVHAALEVPGLRAGGSDRVVGYSESGVRKASKAVGLVPHDARKTFASVLAVAGVDPETLSRVMGHATYATTRDHYIRSLPDERARLARLVGAAHG